LISNFSPLEERTITFSVSQLLSEQLEDKKAAVEAAAFLFIWVG
jgi:hypothetical protein